MELPKTGDRLLGKYVLEEPLGEGGMGVVFAARHELLGERVAVKLVRPEFAMLGDAVARFINEARAAARIKNEHVGRVLDVGMLESGLPYMVLEYLDGVDLARLLRERGPLPIPMAVDSLLQAMEAVAQAHVLGIVHRDLKPSNLFLSKLQDGSASVKVLDFGISKVVGAVRSPGASITQTNSLLGSPLYMSPEQLRDSKGVDHRCDIWALGVVAYELLTGRTPFFADNAVALFAAIQETAPSSLLYARPDVSVQLEAVVMRCLMRRPDDRFQSVPELAHAITPFGSVVAARALENITRILGTRDAPPGRSPLPSAPEVRRSAPQFEAYGREPGTPPYAERPRAPPPTPAALAASVGAPWSRSGAGEPPKRRIVAVAFAALGTFAALVSSVAIVALPRLWPDKQGPASSAPLRDADLAPSASFASDPPLPSSTAPSGEPAPPLRTETAPDAAAFPSSPAASRKAPPSPPRVTAEAGPRSAAAPSQASLSVAAPPPPAPPPPQTPPPAPPSCNPPYEFDPSGRKVWKRECL